MEQEFTYRELSEKLDINLAKLKRWGREFLPPDVAAGQSQGVARILTIDEAFLLFFAGRLVANIKYSIPETKKIMELLIPWLKEKKLMPSLFSMKEFVKCDWSLKIRFFPEYNESIFRAEGILSEVYYKESIILYKDFEISKRRIEEQKIVETVKPIQLKIDVDLAKDKYTSKTVYLHGLCLWFFLKIKGDAFLDEFAFARNPEKLIFSDKE